MTAIRKAGIAGTMDLFFPQWQGCAHGQAMYRGAQSAREIIGSDEAVEIDVSQDGVSPQVLGINNRDLLLRYARDAVDAIKRTSPATLRTIGGDCGVELVPVSYLNDYYRGDIGVVWLDAHGDLNTPTSSPSADFHGMPLRTLFGEGDDAFVGLCARYLRPEQVVLAGVRDLGQAEAEYIERRHLTVLSPATLNHAPDALVELLRQRGFERLYVHLDADVVEPTDLSSVLMPTAGGVTLDALCAVLTALDDNFDIVGHSVLELTASVSKATADDRRALFKLWSDRRA